MERTLPQNLKILKYSRHGREQNASRDTKSSLDGDNRSERVETGEFSGRLPRWIYDVGDSEFESSKVRTLQENERNQHRLLID